jgi:hypothetical protein
MQLFPLAGAIPQLECSGKILGGTISLTEIAIHDSDALDGAGEVWIEFDGALKKGQPCGRAFFPYDFSP